MFASPPRAVVPVLALLAAAGLGHAAPAAAAPALTVVGADGQLRIHLGQDVDGVSEPRHDEVIVRSPEGAWSSPSRLPSPRPGIPLVHRGMTWLLENRMELGGLAYHALLPVTGELGLAGVRLEHVQGQRGAAAVQVIDDWTFLVSELGPEGRVFARVITSHGSSFEMEVLRDETWSAGWAEGTRLVAAGEAGPLLVVLARSGDAIVGTAYDSAAVSTFPPLDVAGLRSVAACVTIRGPVVVGARGHELVAFAWEGVRWSGASVLGLAPGTEVAALGVTTTTAERDAAHAVALLAGEPRFLAAAPVSATGAWGPLERIRLASVTAPDGAMRPRPAEPDLADVERRAERLRRLRWGLVIAAFPILVLLLRQLARLR